MIVLFIICVFLDIPDVYDVVAGNANVSALISFLLSTCVSVSVVITNLDDACGSILFLT